ncbi:MAG: hypothetical protein ACYSTL_01440 [Planctomycetota bacterium]|jgi:hypothetical protein
MNRQTIIGLISSAAVLLLPTGLAVCREREELPAREAGTPWAAMAWGVGFLVLICIAAFKHSRRTHLD